MVYMYSPLTAWNNGHITIQFQEAIEFAFFAETDSNLVGQCNDTGHHTLKLTWTAVNVHHCMDRLVVWRQTM